MSEQPNMRARDQADGDRLAEDAPTDVEDRTTAEQELLHAQKMASIGRLAGGIAHDVNNMLSAIRGFAELLHEDLERQPLPPTDELRHSVDAIRSAADRAAALTAQLLALSRGQVRAPVPLNLAIAGHRQEPGPTDAGPDHRAVPQRHGAGERRRPGVGRHTQHRSAERRPHPAAFGGRAGRDVQPLLPAYRTDAGRAAGPSPAGGSFTVGDGPGGRG